MMDWMSDGLKSLLLMEDAFATQNFASFGRYSSHGIARVPWNRSSKVSAWKLPTFKSTRSVVLRKIIGAADRLRIADKRHTAILHLADLISEIQDLLFHDCLQAEMAWARLIANVFNLIFSVLMCHVTAWYLSSLLYFP